MPGANILGDARAGGIVLWSHPSRKTASGANMPVLAIGEEGNGRTIALGIDGAWTLQFSELGTRTAGRGHGALWNGLLGWLMRDPRFETAQLEVLGGCTAGLASTVRVLLLPWGEKTPPPNLALEVERIDAPDAPMRMEAIRPPGSTSVDLVLPPLKPGAYAARLRMAGAASARHDFVCEAGGDEWADSRPDPKRLEALANANRGTFLFADSAASLKLPSPAVVSQERRVTPLAPSWVLSLLAAVLLGIHWITRRRVGLP
jgi:hypothetical protein